MADNLNSATKYVATHRTESLEWGPVKGLGKRFFSDAVPPRELALVDVMAAASGVLITTYKLNGPLRTGTVGE